MVDRWAEAKAWTMVVMRVVQTAEKSDSMMVDYWAETMGDLMADELVDL